MSYDYCYRVFSQSMEVVLVVINISKLEAAVLASKKHIITAEGYRVYLAANVLG